MLPGDPQEVLEDGEAGVGESQAVSQEATTLHASWATTLPNYTLSPAHYYLQCHLATGEAGLVPASSFSVLQVPELCWSCPAVPLGSPLPLPPSLGGIVVPALTCLRALASLLPLCYHFSATSVTLERDSSLTGACFSFSFWFIIKGSWRVGAGLVGWAVHLLKAGR